MTMDYATKNTDRLNPSRLIVDRQSSALKQLLWHLVRSEKGSDVLAPVTVVGPTRYANLSLRQEFGRSGFANVRFIVMPVLSELLGAAALAREGRRPLTEVLESVSLRQVMAQTTGPLAPVREHPTTQASVRASFRELRRADEGVLTALERQGEVRGEIIRLYRDFRRNTVSDWYDVEDLAEAASDAVRKGEASGLADLGLIVFYLPRNTTSAETKLIEALARQNRCAVLLGTTGEDEADTSALTVAAALKPMLGEPRAASAISRLPLLPGEARLHIAPNAHEELRWVIRRITQEAEEQRTPFHRMAILYRMDNPYASLIRDELRLAGIPMTGPDRKTLAGTAAGRTLTGLLGLPGGEFRRAEVMDWLTGCPVRPHIGHVADFNPSRWDSITRKAGIVRRLDQWRNRLNLHAKQLTEEAARRAKAEEITEAHAGRMRAEAAAARNALAFVENLGEDVEPPENGSPWGVFCDWANQLLDHYLAHDILEAESVALDKIRRGLEELRGADNIRAETTLDEFRQTIEDSLRAPMGHLGVTGQGVFVSTIAAAAGMSFDAVWLVGMIEGGNPPGVRPDPLLPESDWRAAGGLSRFAQRIAAERYDYLSAVAASPHRELSYPVADAASQRKAYPSRWFLEQASALEGAPVYTNGLPKLRDRPWLTIDDSGEHALTHIADAALADRHDYNLRRLLQWRHEGNSLHRHPLAQEGTLASAIRLGQRRNLHRLTEFDGNLSKVAEEVGFGHNLEQSPVSATSLESWAVCPFRYFLGHVLRLSALETPEETTTIGALDRGSLVHEILERFIQEASNDGELPAPGEEWNRQSGERLMRIAEDVFRAAESRGVTGKLLLWELEKQDILTDLETFLEEDSKLRANHDTSGHRVEIGFGFGGNTLDVVDPETQVSFRGYIDRIDVSADGRSALVLDYKTGSASPYRALKDDAIDQGKRLQLGVYSLAAQQLIPDATSVQAAYWFATTRGGFQLAPPSYFDINDGDVRERFRKGVSAIMSGIRGGVFPANPGPPDRDKPVNCRFCDFDSLCPARRADLWERKKADTLLSGYLALSGEGKEK